MQNDQVSSGSEPTANGSELTTEPVVDITLLRRMRGSLESEIGYSGRSDLPLLEALRDISEECRRRGGPSEPDALSRLVFRWRRRQAQREAAVAVVRRGRTHAEEASA